MAAKACVDDSPLSESTANHSTLGRVHVCQPTWLQVSPSTEYDGSLRLHDVVLCAGRHQHGVTPQWLRTCTAAHVKHA